MNVELRLPVPCQDWQALARMLVRREDLRPDVTMVVDADGLCFSDCEGRVVRRLPRGQWAGDAIHDIDTMLDLLAWLETEFGERVAGGRFGCPVRGWQARDLSIR